jgi:hypothetical protein
VGVGRRRLMSWMGGCCLRNGGEGGVSGRFGKSVCVIEKVRGRLLYGISYLG